jgi:hypothetical protein
LPPPVPNDPNSTPPLLPQQRPSSVVRTSRPRLQHGAASPCGYRYSMDECGEVQSSTSTWKDAVLVRLQASVDITHTQAGSSAIPQLAHQKRQQLADTQLGGSTRFSSLKRIAEPAEQTPQMALTALGHPERPKTRSTGPGCAHACVSALRRVVERVVERVVGMFESRVLDSFRISDFEFRIFSCLGLRPSEAGPQQAIVGDLTGSIVS